MGSPALPLTSGSAAPARCAASFAAGPDTVVVIADAGASWRRGDLLAQPAALTACRAHVEAQLGELWPAPPWMQHLQASPTMRRSLAWFSQTTSLSASGSRVAEAALIYDPVAVSSCRGPQDGSFSCARVSPRAVRVCRSSRVLCSRLDGSKTG